MFRFPLNQSAATATAERGSISSRTSSDSVSYTLSAFCKVAVMSALFLWSTFSSSINADADVIWVAGVDKPISGLIVSQSREQVQIKVFADGKFGEVQTFPASEVEAAVSNIDQARLVILTPENPAAYRNYAEELSAMRSDPAAINLSRRLYLLAATNSQDATNSSLRSGAILGLISLAPDDTQRRNLEMYSQLIDPNVETLNVETFKQDSPPVLGTLSTADRELVLRVVVATRQEDTDTAKELLSSAVNRESLKKWSNLCTLQELDRFAAVKQPSKPQLKKLIAVELAARQPKTPSTNLTSEKSTWGDLAMKPASDLGVLPTAASITEFDPLRSVYRNGAWVEP